MIKLVTSHAHSGYALPVSPGDNTSRAGVVLEKMSEDRRGQLDFLSRIGRLDPRVVEWLSRAPIDFGKQVIVLVVPLGADESWEETVNGDAFERSCLRPDRTDWGHKTFEMYAKAFRNHRNKDPDKGFGDVPCAVYNDEMDRVEGVWRLDKSLARKVGATSVIQRIERGGPMEISMGCKVKFDVCSLCGNKAKSTRDYCEHPFRPGFGHVDSLTGKKMRVFNPEPVFFDLSDVFVNAAPEALGLGLLSPEMLKFIRTSQEKTSAAGRVLQVPSAVLGAIRWGYDLELLSGKAKQSSVPVLRKISDMIKEVPVLDAQVLLPMQEDEEDLDLDKVKGSAPAAVLSSLAALGIVCNPREFMRVVGCPVECTPPTPSSVKGMWSFADENSPLVSENGVRQHIMHVFSGEVPSRSIVYPYLGERAVRAMGRYPREPDPLAEVDIQIKIRAKDARVALQYASYLKALSRRMGDLLAHTLQAYPEHASSNLGIGYLTKDSSIREAASVNPYASSAMLPPAYILSRAGMLKSSKDLRTSLQRLNRRGVEHWFGGILTEKYE